VKYNYAVYQNAKMLGVFETQTLAKEFVDTVKAKMGNKEEEQFLKIFEELKQRVLEKGWTKATQSALWGDVCVKGAALDNKPTFKIARITVFENVGEAHT
jgi:hypothetical protein